MVTKTPQVDAHGWTQFARDRFKSFCAERDDITDTIRIGEIVYIYFQNIDWTGKFSITTGYWTWIDADTARKEVPEKASLLLTDTK